MVSQLPLRYAFLAAAGSALIAAVLAKTFGLTELAFLAGGIGIGLGWAAWFLDRALDQGAEL